MIRKQRQWWFGVAFVLYWLGFWSFFAAHFSIAYESPPPITTTTLGVFPWLEETVIDQTGVYGAKLAYAWRIDSWNLTKSALLAAFSLLPLWLGWRWLVRKTTLRGRCDRCGYDLANAPRNVCSECGESIAWNDERHRKVMDRSPVVLGVALILGGLCGLGQTTAGAFAIGHRLHDAATRAALQTSQMSTVPEWVHLVSGASLGGYCGGILWFVMGIGGVSFQHRGRKPLDPQQP